MCILMLSTAKPVVGRLDSPIGTLRHPRSCVQVRKARQFAHHAQPGSVFSMCRDRWNLIGILTHPATRGLDYYARLDTHSNVLSNVSDDMFAHMAAHGLHYGFVAR